MNKKLKIFGLALLTAVIGVGLTASATVLFLGETNLTATSSVAYILTPGTGTTTYYFDSYGSADGKTTGSQDAALEVLAQGSTSPSTLAWKFEYSQGFPGVNCTTSPTKCNWFSDNLQDFSASSSPTIAVRSERVYSWDIAGVAPGLLASSTVVFTANKIFLVKTPTRYTRVLFYAPIGSQPVGFWASFVNRKPAN